MMMRGLLKLVLVGAVLVTAATALSPSADAHQPDGKKAYFETGEGLDFEFRSVAAGFLTNLMLEMDFYLDEKWVAGVNSTHRTTFDTEACLGACRRENRFSIFGERIWGGRWAHVGLRAGPYAGNLFHQFHGENGRELARKGPMFGFNLGAAATVTPFRWVGVTLTASAFPGVFVGRESSPHCWGCFHEENAEPARSFEFTGMVALLVRVGDLDGPERDCRACGLPPSSPEPSESESENMVSPSRRD